ncbi:SMP-30/gluconolactonase/LRE family protein [Paenibacillus qinlingensis]|uniref:Sugar lactone lactonase YvrE n=1 Tax=Paenibacillus qinlingensis TaxID=1837343 RepID=A0ABU1P1J5_9BACL|nr:SMP-30/gluconolactonase/LRE family protein [Paenibacillus qinlingensis]MDR6553191.1 sugar lactone lactonase YvrE [Paenibacillus qinlingensis]
MSDSNFISRSFTEPFGFTKSIEGPACDREGNLYAVNFARRHTIGKVTPAGECTIFLELAEGSTGCGMRTNQHGDLFIADHTGHNILKVDIATRLISVYVHEPTMNQPNDLAITSSGVIFASDPNWKDSTGQIWRMDPSGNGRAVLLEANMGTTNGIEVSPDEKTLYVNETRQRRIWAYDLSADFQISHKRLFIEFPDFGLDGMRCDIAGNLYVTRHGKGTIAKISPSGEILVEVPLLGKDCTNLTFGGPDGRNCYVTVADTGNIQLFQADLPGRCWQLLQET